MKTLPTQNHWVRALVASGNFLYSGSYQAVKVWLFAIFLFKLCTRKFPSDMELGEPGSGPRSSMQWRQCLLLSRLRYSHNLWDV